MVVWVYEKSAQCPAGRRPQAHHARTPEVQEQTVSYKPSVTETGVMLTMSRSLCLRTPGHPSPEPKISFTDKIACAEDSHLLVQIQYLIIAKHAFHTNWSHFHR